MNDKTAAQAEPAQKIALVFAPLIKQHTKEIIDELTKTITAQMQEIQHSISELQQEVKVLEKSVISAKKTIPRGEKKTPAEPTTTPANIPVVPANENTYSSNKMVWLRNNWKVDDNFRNHFMKGEIATLMSSDPTISSKTDVQKRIAEATFYWNYAKDREELYSAIVAQHSIAKEKHDLANKAPQQTVEPHTPPQD